MKTIKWLGFASLVLLTCNLNAQVIADFETPQSTPALTAQTGDAANTADNPTMTGNPSAKVAYYKKAVGDWHAIFLNFSSDINIGQHDKLTFKINSSTTGRVYVKIDNGSTVLHEDWAPVYGFMPPAGQWTECTFDLSAIQNQTFNKLEINASVDGGTGANPLAADVYLDDFKLSSSLSPNGEPIISLTILPAQIVAGQSVNFDASGSVDYDGTISSYAWDFGDGFTGTGSIIDHTYSADGIFDASLVITDNDNKKTTKKMKIFVLPVSGKTSSLAFFTPSPSIFEKIEAGFVVNGTYANVYDPDEVTINATITLPDQSTLIVPCFYFQPGYYQLSGDTWLKDANTGYWMLRFSSPQSGLHKVVISVTDKDGTVSSSESQITVTTGTRKGYVGVDSKNKQYYRYSTGEPYHPLGINQAWDNITNYTNTFTALSKGSANLVRYWQVPFNRQALEWKNGSGFYKGIGVYSQEAAAEQDSVFALCEKNNIQLQVTLFQHGMFSENVDSNWSDNPYNAVNSPPAALSLDRAEKFFYTDAVKKQTKKLLRYIVARWGYSTNIFAWELFNEVQFTGINGSQTQAWRDGVLSWHNEMGQYIKSLDAFHHTVTSSYDDAGIIKLDKLTGLDVVQYHLYDPNLLTVQVTKDKNFLSQATRTGVINGEYGLNVSTADVPMDAQRVSIWTSVMTQVPHLMWLWNNYQTQAWADLFKYPAAYLQAEDFANEGTLKDWSFVAKYGTSALGSVGFGSAQNFYGVVYDASNRTNLSKVQCDLSTMPSARYKFTFMDGTTGVAKDTTTDVFAGVKVTMPQFSKVMAFKAKYVSATIGQPPVPPVIAGVNEINVSTELNIYPNPTREEAFVDVSLLTTNKVDVEISDVMGKKITAVSFTKSDFADGYLKINFKKYNLPTGIYLVRFNSDQASFKRKVFYIAE